MINNISPAQYSPMISVIVPVYKVEQYLDQCVQSLLRQSFSAFEMILVDDGSPDHCGEMCESYANKDSRVRVIHQKNGGLSAARNRGLEIAKGRYIAFVDSDDWVDPDYLQFLYQGIMKYDAGISICNFCMVLPDGSEVPWRPAGQGYTLMTSLDAVEDMLYTKSFDTSAWGKLYPRDCFQEIRYPVGELYEEVATTYKLLLTQQTVAVGNFPGYYYRKRPESIVARRFSLQSMDMLKHTQEMAEFLTFHYPTLTSAATRRIVYACFYLLKTIGGDYRNYPVITDSLISTIKANAPAVMRDPKAPRRDKAAILMVYFGKHVFAAGWSLYARLRRMLKAG